MNNGNRSPFETSGIEPEKVKGASTADGFFTVLIRALVSVTFAIMIMLGVVIVFFLLTFQGCC